MRQPALIAAALAGACALAALVAVAAPDRPALASIATYEPVGVAAGGDGRSAAWLLDRQNRRVVLCRESGQPAAPPECRAATLPP